MLNASLWLGSFNPIEEYKLERLSHYMVLYSILVYMLRMVQSCWKRLLIVFLFSKTPLFSSTFYHASKILVFQSMERCFHYTLQSYWKLPAIYYPLLESKLLLCWCQLCMKIPNLGDNCKLLCWKIKLREVRQSWFEQKNVLTLADKLIYPWHCVEYFRIIVAYIKRTKRNVTIKSPI